MQEAWYIVCQIQVPQPVFSHGLLFLSKRSQVTLWGDSHRGTSVSTNPAGPGSGVPAASCLYPLPCGAFPHSPAALSLGGPSRHPDGKTLPSAPERRAGPLCSQPPGPSPSHTLCHISRENKTREPSDCSDFPAPEPANSATVGYTFLFASLLAMSF